MLRIIVATDFSHAAENAAHYACELAAVHNCSVIVVHAYMMPVVFNDTSLQLMPIGDTEEASQEHLDGLVNALKAAHTNVQLEGKVFYGNITDVISDWCREGKADLVVVGNSGSGDTAGWLGSTVLELMREIKTPVLGIPRGYVFNPVNNICLSCDEKDLNESIDLSAFLKIVVALRAELHVLHISDAGKTIDYDSTRLHDQFKTVPVKYHQSIEIDVDDAIKKFVAVNGMDWLSVIPHSHSFFSGLFHKSHTKAMLHHSQVPLLSLHDIRN